MEKTARPSNGGLTNGTQAGKTSSAGQIDGLPAAGMMNVGGEREGGRKERGLEKRKAGERKKKAGERKKKAGERKKEKEKE